MHELGTELGRYIGGTIDLTQLRAAFITYLNAQPEQRDEVALWLRHSVESGRLSQSVWGSLSDLLEQPPTAMTPRPRVDVLATVLKPLPASDLGGATRMATRQIDRRSPAQPQATQQHGRSHSPLAQAAGELCTGMVVRDRFVLMEELGSGGMGKVFKARDLRREEAQDRHPFIALKILKGEISSHPDSFMALQREARRAGTLAHPNVVSVYDFDRDGDRIYMTMEYLEGRPLDSYLRTEYVHGTSFAAAWPIIHAVGLALECGHNKRIVHSDLKPGNIFVCSDGVVKVLDFGISRLIRPVDGTGDETIFDPGKRLGGLTPAYASLEMWTHDSPDPRDDIYALACVSYELLTGKHPFNRASARDVKDKKLVPARINGLTRRQWDSIRNGLALRRAQRTSTVGEYLKGLEPRTLWQRMARPVTITAAIASVLAIVIGARFYKVAVEESTMEVMQCAQSIRPAEKAAAMPAVALTPEMTEKISGDLDLAASYLEEATPDTALDALKSNLSDGPNSVNDILDRVLAVDPKNTNALKLKRNVADIYAARAQQSLDRSRTAEALELIRAGRAVLPDSEDMFRLEQQICRADAQAVAEVR